MTEVLSTNPVTGERIGLGFDESTSNDVTLAGLRAAGAARNLSAQSFEWRAGLLEMMASSLEDDAGSIVSCADRETGLGDGRLSGELRRTCFQFRFFANVVRDGAFLEASIDHAHDSPMGPLPDLRRQLEPLGPVGVFGASNFPFAFSVPGGDTASALAAGCPVIIKAHPSHPMTSKVTFDSLAHAARSHGAPEASVQLIFGLTAGSALVGDLSITAIGFTGSYQAGRALFDLAQARPTPIPFYGELGSVNPLVVSPDAAEARPAALGEGLVSSVALGSGQFCTKPGLIFIPVGDGGDTVVRSARTAVSVIGGAPMLSEAIRNRFVSGVEAILAVPGVSLIARSASSPAASGADVVIVETNAQALRGEQRSVLETECFGAVAIVVRYDGRSELLEVLETLDPALTFTCHVEEDDPYGPSLLAIGRRKCGRVIVNGFPTGVGVSWSMHHGGPLPAATSSLHSSVGASAMRRWLRPVSYQAVPDPWLPESLQEANPLAIPRRVDGTLLL